MRRKETTGGRKHGGRDCECEDERKGMNRKGRETDGIGTRMDRERKGSKGKERKEKVDLEGERTERNGKRRD